MPVTTKPGYSIERAMELLEGAAARLLALDWFSRDWLYTVHCYPYPPQAPESVTLHVFRPNWFNHNKQGIHFETSLGKKQWQACQLPIALHVFHTTEIPGTRIKRKAVTKPFIDSLHDTIASWSGYEFRAGLYGCQSFSKSLAFDFDNFDAVVAKEMAKLCLELGPALDLALASALANGGVGTR